MKKILSTLLILLTVAASVQAQEDPNRQRERDARDRLMSNQQGYLVPGGPRPPAPYPGQPNPPPPPPGNGYPYPGNPYPSPSNPYPAPGYDMYGPAVTVQWLDMGTYKAQKLVDTNITLDVRGRLVNEIYVTAQKNSITIRSAYAYMSNGQPVEIRNLLGNIRENMPVRTQLDYRNSLRVDRIVLNIEATNLIGSRGNLLVQLGLAN